jgi:hypothetical protein
LLGDAGPDVFSPPASGTVAVTVIDVRNLHGIHIVITAAFAGEKPNNIRIKIWKFAVFRTES